MMPANTAQDQELLDRVLDLGEFGLRDRLQGMGLIALTFVGLVGWRMAVAWLAAATVIHLLLAPGLRGIAALRWSPRARIRAAMGLLAASHAFNGVLAFTAAFTGPWGFVLANTFLMAMVVFGVRTRMGSRHAFYAAVGPYSILALALPAVALATGAPIVMGFALVLATSVFLLHFYDVYRRNVVVMKELTEARDRAEAATEAKSAFVAMVSHELRTPISGILAGSAALGASVADRSAQSQAALIEQSARMMRTLLNDLLDLSKIEAGRMTVEAIPFELRRLVLDTVGFWRSEAKAKGLRFRLEGARHLPAWTEGDPTRLRQIINNLISNALKFTPTGAITLRFTVVDDGRLRIEVCDTGLGMDEAQMARLFGAYDQLSDGRARTHGGTGLGLNISHRLAGLMSATLTARSAVGKGTTFELDLPLRTVEPPATAVAYEAPARGLSILVVDDHEVNRQAFTLILEGFCDRVAAAENGAAALEQLASETFDLVLMDINMPVMGGFDAARRLRATAGPNQGIPILALSASVTEGDVAASLEAGMDGFVRKPVDAEELITAISQALEQPPRLVTASGG